MKTLWSLSLLLLLSADIVVSAQQKKVDYCEPSSKVKKELTALQVLDDDDALNYRQKFSRRMEILPTLLKKYPKDFHALKVNLDYRNDWYLGDYEKLSEEYRASFESNPNDLFSGYLYSQLITGHDTKKAIEILEKSTIQYPDFPWTYLKLAEIYASPVFRDENKSKDNLRKWYRACPTSANGYWMLSKVDDRDLMRDVARNRRMMLEKSKDPEELTYWSGLWSLEFKVTPSTEHPQVRIRIEDDLNRLRASKINHKNRLEALRSGYKMLGDKLGLKWVENEMLRSYPTSRTTLSWLWQSWREVNKWPDVNDSDDKKKEYYREKRKFTDEWLKQWPNDWGLLESKFMASKELDDLSSAEIQNLAELLLKAESESDIDNYSIPPTSVEITKTWLKRQIAVDGMSELILNDLKKEEWRSAKQSQSDLYNKPGEKVDFGNLTYSQWEAWPVLINIYLALKQPDKSREVISLMTDSLNKLTSSEKSNNDEKILYSWQQSTYWAAVGKIAEFENRKLDALMSYQTAMSLRPKAPKKDDEIKNSFDRVWKELGGTSEGLTALSKSKDSNKNTANTASSWNEKNDPLVDFDLTDLQGKKWKRADLKGKTVFINFWATWCPPCIQELPFVDKLHKQMKDNSNVLVLTFNIDDSVGLVEPFIKKHNFSFPTVLAESLTSKIELTPIPRNWIVDLNGNIKFEVIGFDSDGEAFMKKTIDAIEKLKNKQ